MKLKIWAFMFYFLLVTTIIQTCVSVIMWVIIPNIDVTITLSGKIWLIFVFGGLNRSVLQGFFLYYSYVQMKSEKREIGK